MARGTESARLSPSSGGSDLEEGELVAGPDNDILHVGDGLPEFNRRSLVAVSDLEEGELVAGPDDDIIHVGDGLLEFKRRSLEFEGIAVDGGALPSPTPSCDRDSDGTITDVDADAGAASLAQELLFLGPVCRTEFTSQTAVSGLVLSAHGPHGHLEGKKERPAVASAVSAGWGSVGGRSVSSGSEGVVDSTATVVSEPVMDPMPLAFASWSSSASAEPDPPSDDSMDIDVEPPRNHTNKIVVRPPCSPKFLQGDQPAAPRVLVPQDRPTVAQGHQLPPEAMRRFVLRQAAAPQVVVHHVQRAWRPRPARDEQGLWICGEKGCGAWFSSYSGLGGHMSGHTARMRNEELAAAGLHLGVGDPKPAKLHPFKHCPSVFTSGGQLGGHMRKHYERNVAPKKPVIDPMPIAFASRSSSSAEPNPPNADSVAIVVESSCNHANKVVVRPPCSPRFLQGHQPAAPHVVVRPPCSPRFLQGHQPAAPHVVVRPPCSPRFLQGHQPAAPQVVVRPPCSPRFLQGHQPAAPQVVVAQDHPTLAQGQQLAEEAARQFVPHQAAAPQVAAYHVQRTSPPRPARHEQGWWLCKEAGCDQRCATPQELGVHMLAHNMTQDNEAAAVALHLGTGPATFHPCKHCPGVFTSRKQLGSHMRKHYEGNVRPKKPGATPNVSARELASALALPVPMLPATMVVAPAQPAVAPSSPVLPVPGALKIFGVNIVGAPPGAAKVLPS